MEDFKIDLPCNTESVFDRIVSLGWYDGLTSGVLRCAADLSPFRFDLLAWGPGQEPRIFAMSSLTSTAFDEFVRILSKRWLPKWPVWDLPWPNDPSEIDSLNGEVDAVLNTAKQPSLVIETNSLFRTITGLKAISEGAPQLPQKLERDYPSGDYRDWHMYLESPR